MTADSRSNIIVISGPGGVGKGTVVDELIARDPNLVVSRSWTTREQRPGEADEAYTFVSGDEFEAAIEAGAFLEYDHHFGNYYGSPVPSVNDGRDLILEIDVNGAMQLVNNGHAALFIFIDTPSIEEQRRRMLSRGDAEEKVEERLEGGEREREFAAALPYVHVINDDLDRCTTEVLGLIEQYRGEAQASEDAFRIAGS